jgi:hypothetical protein
MYKTGIAMDKCKPNLYSPNNVEDRKVHQNFIAIISLMLKI